jgi:hypothetical protein
MLHLAMRPEDSEWRRGLKRRGSCSRVFWALVWFLVTKGVVLKIDPADRTPRKTLEKRLEKTPINARCFAQGLCLMC